MNCPIVSIEVSTPLQKNWHPLFCQDHLKSANCPSHPFLGYPPYDSPSTKNRIFPWTPKILKFFFLHPNTLVVSSAFPSRIGGEGGAGAHYVSTWVVVGNYQYLTNKQTISNCLFNILELCGADKKFSWKGNTTGWYWRSRTFFWECTSRNAEG